MYIIATFPSKKLDINIYPAIKNYLLKFDKRRLEQSGHEYVENGVVLKSRKKTKNKWFETQDSIAYSDDFFKQKIIYSEIVQKPQFFLDNKQNFFPEATAFIMTGNDLELVIACLNSKLYSYSFKKFYSGGGLGESGFRYKKIFLEKLPLPILSKENKFYEQIKDLVLQINKENSQTEKNKLINKIDDLLYDLTQLNKKERRLINES